jgi:predicted transcriptional regulator
VTEKAGTDRLIGLTTDVVSAYVSNNPVPAGELPRLIGQVHAALKAVSPGLSAAVAEPLTPAVPINKSVLPDFIICLEDGKKLKTLKRHLGTRYGLTPDAYRAKWNLPADYPMVAPSYSAARSALAKSSSLGHRPKEVRPAPARRTRKKMSA